MRIGCVKYLNARPLIHGWLGPVVFDHPAALCQKLAAGDLDVALVSSFEFLRNPIYRIVDGISISSDGPVYSVVVAHVGEDLLSNVEVDPASQTSVALLQYLMGERGQAFREGEKVNDLLSPIADGRSRLLIGDQAIRFRRKFGDRCKYWDLGEQWKNLINLPFVYALWLVRPEVTETAELADKLRSVRDRNLQDIERVIAEEREFDPEFCRRYYTCNLRFSFDERDAEGLHQFANACAKLNLIPKRKLDLQLV